MVVVLLFVGVALWTTWPLARSPASTLPLGSSRIATVPLFNLWTIWWNADRASHGFQNYWHAPIFHPTADAFAFSEPQPTTLLVAPVLWLTGSRTLAYNSYLWMSLVLNGVFAARLLRQLGTGRLIAIGGGVAMQLLPLVHAQLDVVQLTPVWGILWTWSALLSWSQLPSLKRGCQLGAAFGVTCWMCAHHGLFLALLLAAAIWILPRQWRSAALWRNGLVAIGVAVAITAPMAIEFHQVFRRHQFTRSANTVEALAASPADYLTASGQALFNVAQPPARTNGLLSPGWIKVGLAIVGIAVGILRRRWRRATLFFSAIAGLAFLLSLGPHLRLGTWQPWWTLTKFVPGFAQVRSASRFGFFVQITVVLLSAQGCRGLWLSNRRLIAGRRLRCASFVAIAALGCLAILEVRPDTTNLARTPDELAAAGWIDFIREHTPAGRAIACWPFARGNRVDDFERTTQWMYFATFHRVPLVNGYSGFFPETDFLLREAINARIPTEEIFRRLADKNVEFLVTARAETDGKLLTQTRFDAVSLDLVFTDRSGIDVFRLRRIK